MDGYDFDRNIYRQRLCVLCNTRFSSVVDLERHLFEQHNFWSESNSSASLLGSGETTVYNDVTFSKKDFVDNVYTEYQADCSYLRMKTCEDLFSFLLFQLQNILGNELKLKKSIKVSLALEVLFSKQDTTQGKEIFTEPPPVFNSFQHAIFNRSMITRFLRTVCAKITLDQEYFTVLRSGWNIDHIMSLTIKVIKIGSIKGGLYMELPMSLKHKERSGCLLNVRNVPDEIGSQNLCFLYSILAHDEIAGLQGPSRSRFWKDVEQYKNPETMQKINTTGMSFPIDLNNLDEEMSIFHENNTNISLTILGYHEEEETKPLIVGDAGKGVLYQKKQERLLRNLFPIYSYEHDDKRKIKVDLLLVFNKDMSDSHFVLIRSLSSLLRHDNRYARQVCRKCFQQFNNPDSLAQHKTFCVNNKSILRFPSDKNLCFKDYQKTLLVPYTYFWDSESYLAKPDTDKTSYIHEHKCAGWSYNCIDWNGNLVSSNVYVQENPDDNPMEMFLLNLFADIKCRIDMLDEFQEQAYSQINMTDIDFSKLLNGTDDRFTKCGFCHKDLNGEELVLHHSHLPPFNFEFFACSNCNLSARMPYICNVICHNSSSYDNSYLMQSIHSAGFDDVQVLAKSREKMLSIIVRIKSKTQVAQVRFLDSMSFLQSSLANITKSLYADGAGHEKFEIVREEFKEEIKKVPEKYFFEKLIFPYTSLTCFADLSKVQFLDSDLYTNDLTNEKCCEKDLDRVKDLCRLLDIKNLRELTSIYCRLDTALLSSVFTQFRLLLYNTFKVDCCHFFSLPSYSYACALKTCKEKLEYITQPDIYRFWLKAKRGGYSSVGSRMYAKASNPYLPSHLYDKTKESSYITYLDLNSLYGFSLMQSLPTRDFKFLEKQEINELLRDGVNSFLENLDINAAKGYLLEVSFTILPEHHDKFNDLPPGVEMKQIYKEQLSDYQLYFKDELDEKDAIFTTKRLIGDLNPKENYVVHSRTLKKYVELGVIVTNVGRVLEFQQAPFFRNYIEKLMNFRKTAQSKFESDTFKLSMNSLFGFTILDRERMMDIKLVTEPAKALTYSNSPLLDEIISINENLLLFVMRRKSILLSSAVQIGISVLDISKAILYEYYYQVLKRHVPDVSIIIIDTDGFLVYSKENIYSFLINHKFYHDLSGYNKNDPLFSNFHSPENAGVPGKMKDENPGSVIYEAIALRPKMYCFKYVSRVYNPETQRYEFKEGDEMEIKKAKGIPKHVVKTDLTFLQYFRSLFSPKITSVKFNSIQRKKHKLYTIQMTKKALNSLDMKRYRVNPTTTLAYGHKDIQKLHRKGICYEIDDTMMDDC